jgi:hypothetical protein
MSVTQNAQLEIALATVLTVLGIILTSWSVMGHVALLVAPGALLITLGGAWLGNAMARHDVRLFAPAEPQASESES